MTKTLEVFVRGLDFDANGIPSPFPRIHPILKIDNEYIELANVHGKIKIIRGKIEDLWMASNYYMKRHNKPDRYYTIEIDKFNKSVEKFKSMFEGKRYFVLNFENNCIAFRWYVVNNSKVN